jgi:hypothetical protein
MGVSMVIAPWGEGVNVCCVPPPPRQIARRPPKTRVKRTLDGVLGRAPTRRALPRNIGFFFMKIYVMRIWNVQ